MSFEDLDVPYFVYGTLRPGESNANLWEGLATCDEVAWRCPAYALVEDIIPYALPETTIRHGLDVGCLSATGNLLVPLAGEERRLRMALDTLEGHPVGYTRTFATVRRTDGHDEIVRKTAWIYAYNHLDILRRATAITSGDYLNRGGYVTRTTSRGEGRISWSTISNSSLQTGLIHLDVGQ